MFRKSRNERELTGADLNKYVDHQRKSDGKDEIIGKELIRPPSWGTRFGRWVCCGCVDGKADDTTASLESIGIEDLELKGCHLHSKIGRGCHLVRRSCIAVFCKLGAVYGEFSGMSDVTLIRVWIRATD